MATGAADGYGRMAGKPAMCLLHLGPGLANGLTNLHDARRASTPILTVIGDHATRHAPVDPLLASDIDAVARFVSGFVKRTEDAATLAMDVARTIAATHAHGGQIATLIVPHDVQLADVTGATPAFDPAPQTTFSERRVMEAARALERGRAALLPGGAALGEAGLALAGRIAAASGAELVCDTFFARMERGGTRPARRRLPYFPHEAVELTRRYEHVVVAGTRRPVAFFGSPGVPSYLAGEEQTVMPAGADEDAPGALAARATQLNAPAEAEPSTGGSPPRPEGPLTAEVPGAVIARTQPADAIVMDEAVTVGAGYFEASRHAARFTHLTLAGGAIGEGPGAATGAALACPGRRVVSFQSDGCGAYSVQALWTQAREQLDVVTIIGANRRYNIPEVELRRSGHDRPGPVTRSMTALDQPRLDWVRIAEGFGVPAVAVETAEDLTRELERALADKRPRLIEAIMS